MNRLLLGLALLTLVSACGIPGGLERPDPLWNRDEAIRAECARQAAQGQSQDPRCAQYETAVDAAEAAPPQQ